MADHPVFGTDLMLCIFCEASYADLEIAHARDCPHNGDPYRWCIYCGVDCKEFADQSLTTHRSFCPQVTGLFPVRARDLQPGGMVCTECNAPFRLGEHYALLPIGEDDTVEVVCVGCKIIGVVSNDG